MGPADCDERLVWVRISVFGQDGPYSQRPGLDRLGIGYGGLLHLTGYPDRPPVRPGVTVSDYLTGVFAAEAAIAALYERDVRGTGRGRVVDAPLYGSVLRILEWTIAGYDRLGVVRGREGNRLANCAPLDNYPTADGKYVCIVAGSDANFRRLCNAMGRPDLLDRPALGDARATRRARRRDQRHRRRLDVGAHRGRGRGRVHRPRRAGRHRLLGRRHRRRPPHGRPRRPRHRRRPRRSGPCASRRRSPASTASRRAAPAGAPTLGEHNDEVWCGLVGLSPEELAAPRRRQTGLNERDLRTAFALRRECENIVFRWNGKPCCRPRNDCSTATHSTRCGSTTCSARPGFSTRAFYRHFHGRTELFLALLADETERAADRLDGRMDAARHARGQGADVGRGRSSRWPTTAGSRRAPGCSRGERASLAQEFPAEVERCVRTQLAPLEEVIAAGRDEGTFPARGPGRRRARAVHHLCAGLMADKLWGSAAMSRQRAVALATGFALQALRADGDERRPAREDGRIGQPARAAKR